MQHKLTDAADLLKMVELVIQQHANQPGEFSSSDNQFPWAGVRLTLKQARELVLEAAAAGAPIRNESRAGDSRNAVPAQRPYPDQRQPEHRQPDQRRPERAPREEVRPHRNDRNAANNAGNNLGPAASRPKEGSAPAPAGLSSNSADAPFRGTFNRIQLTEETVDPREEQSNPSSVSV